ncbi:MAG: sigma-54-dependent Fis family transcriptional regulator [Candidatus Omnitrophica bacterium]|nr:sigma-54-dependent Fis family transcriptional regulator [Candidatus Omnitrophota bacterium]
MQKTILIVDDDPKIANLIDFRLKKMGHTTYTVHRGLEAMEYIKQHTPMLVMLDIRLPDTNGVELLKEIQKSYPHTHVIIISAHADVKMAVDCMKLGAYDFVEKPIAFAELDTKVKHLYKQFHLTEEVSMLRRELGEKYKFKSMIGKSPEIKKVFDAIDLATKSEVNVLIEGDSGTGKELVARAIHFNGLQKQGPFVAVNCAAIPENLLESELFGHEKGAFTGALARRIGKFEQAQGGTLFLDEIADLPASLQVKLLRVLQEREIERVGGQSAIPIHVRFIVATNKDSKKLVEQGQFREDLYFRLNVFPIRIPPLRDRREDIPELFKYFMEKHLGKKSSLRVEPDALKILMAYEWPGNIRELENLTERLMLVKRGNGDISTADISSLLEPPKPFTSAVSAAPAADDLNWKSKEKVIGDTERTLLENALQASGGNISKASKLLNISRDTFYRKMKKYSLSAI